MARSGLKGGKRMSIGEYGQIYGMMFPNLLLFAVFSVYPIIWVFKFIFYRYDGLGGAEPEFIGLANFERIFTRDADFWNSVWNTFVYAGGKILLVIPIAFMVAFLLNGTRKGKGVLRAIVFLPTIMSTAVMALVFYLIFNVYNGEINRYLMWSGIITVPVDWLGIGNAMITCIILGVWGGLGNYMVYFLAGLQRIPAELYESASLEGVSKPQEIWYITLPMLGPILKIIVMLAIINAFNDMGSILVLTEGGPLGTTTVMFLYVYQFFFPISIGAPVAVQYGYGATAALLSALIVGVVTVIYLALSRRLDEID